MCAQHTQQILARSCYIGKFFQEVVAYVARTDVSVSQLAARFLPVTLCFPESAGRQQSSSFICCLGRQLLLRTTNCHSFAHTNTLGHICTANKANSTECICSCLIWMFDIMHCICELKPRWSYLISCYTRMLIKLASPVLSCCTSAYWVHTMLSCMRCVNVKWWLQLHFTWMHRIQTGRLYTQQAQLQWVLKLGRKQLHFKA